MDFDTVVNRKGTFCTQWDYVQDRFGVANLLPFTISDTDFALPDEVMTALKERLQHPVFGYTRWNHETFKQSILHWYEKRFTSYLAPEDIVYSPTVMYSISKLLQIVSKKGEGVIVQTPAYDAFYKTIDGNERKIIPNPLRYEEGQYEIDWQDLELKLASQENTVLLLCSPHNPTGRVWQKEELTKIVSLCWQYDVFLISDEIHMDILRKGQKHYPIIDFMDKNVALVTSGSKTFNFPGLIFSYAILPDERIREQFQLALKNQDGLSSASNLGMLATMTAYYECSYWVDELNEYLDDNFAFAKKYLAANLPQIKSVDSAATYLMWLDITKLNLPMEVVQRCLIEIGQVAIMDGSVYGDEGSNFLRLNIGCSKSKLELGLEKMVKSFT
ncbi:aminotransferase [Enterococcus saigonensis]|uniref:cysteine-S-conjugate beta-lyase n=1 Tax=Enterococcus saigonensis TaxID=1805431 RepID=A0A679ILY4_9ENTE|nr:MalY/PatB family protein [Enterococcus saigonensis]BCA86535.1 aminotransferase [Enterococcus saigonensis]